MENIEKEAWNVESGEWRENRHRQWLKEGMPLVTSMYQRGGDLNPKSAEAIKKYFLTGKLIEEIELPLFYILRFYPRKDPEWLEKTILNASDSQLRRFVFMYKVDSLGIHDGLMADFWFSDKVTKRLNQADSIDERSQAGDLAATRDLYMTEKNCLFLRRSMKRKTELKAHYIYSIGNDWLEIAQNFSRRLNCRDQAFVDQLEILMKSVLLCLLSKESSSAEHGVAFQTKKLLDTGLVGDYDLSKRWRSEKASSHIE